MRSLDKPASSQKRKGLFHVIGALAAGALLAAACASGGSTSPSPTASLLPIYSPPPTLGPTSSAASSATTSGFPRTVVDDEGTSVTLNAPPQHIVSLTPATTELLFALGAGSRVAGRTESDDYPAAAASVPPIASYTGVVIEKVAAIQPDLVLAGGNGFTAAADISRLRDLGYPVLVLYAASVDDVLADIQLVGRAIGADDQSSAMVDGMRARIDGVKSAVSSFDQPTVFYEIGYQPDIYAPAPDSFVADMVSLAGGAPVTTGDPKVFSISLEKLVAANPDLIVLGDAAYGTCPADVAARPGWNAISAVRDGNIRSIDDTLVTRPGPRLAEGLADLALTIHPDTVIQPPVGAATYCAGTLASPSASPVGSPLGGPIPSPTP